ncbi:hypothetical protein Aglo01_40360 [Actinokineospora globicatena]|nr:hypothetical protein Aglo01_40360 [Actinokineospora globicatena]GLW86036.1 hypothetical protein Aglo02_36750 [Actinokineospora globicatena]
MTSERRRTELEMKQLAATRSAQLLPLSVAAFYDVPWARFMLTHRWIPAPEVRWVDASWRSSRKVSGSSDWAGARLAGGHRYEQLAHLGYLDALYRGWRQAAAP